MTTPTVHKWRWMTVRHWTIGLRGSSYRPRLHITFRMRRRNERMAFFEVEL